MKKIYLILIAFGILYGCSGSDFVELEQHDGLLYKKGSSELFSGLCTENYKNGKLAYTGKIKDGLKEGAWVWFHQNGQKRCEVTYVKGLEEGKKVLYTKEGKVQLEIVYTAGQAKIANP
jgi:antitoxin component YwqK of YwqJK toxin-antitoxin module